MSKYKSHSCCFEQGEDPACGRKGYHINCCICRESNPEPTSQHTSREEIEKAYPEAYKLARKFHILYEQNAPIFGYETRTETKEFDPSSPNGRLMAYVCWILLQGEINLAELRGYEKGSLECCATEGEECVHNHH